MTCSGESVAASFAEGYKSEWSYSEVAGEGTAGSYTVSAAGLTPGTWTGTANFGCGLETSRASTITFTLRGVQYQANAGMTWGEWIASEYNNAGTICVCGETGVHYKIDSKEGDLYDNGCVSIHDIIIDGKSYVADVCYNYMSFKIDDCEVSTMATSGLTWEQWLNEREGIQKIRENLGYEYIDEDGDEIILSDDNGMWYTLTVDGEVDVLKTDLLMSFADYSLKEWF